MAVTIKCPTCHKSFVVPSEVLGLDGHQVIVRMDRSEVVNHDCQPAALPAAAKPDAPKAIERKRAEYPRHPALAGRISLMLDREDFVSIGGSRACTMCGTKGQACLDGLRKPGKQGACCGACGEGNTHPAPGESLGMCAQWAAEKVGPIR